MPRVLNKHRDKIPADAVYIGRGSPWGNPFEIGKDGTRDDVIDRFEEEILPTLDVTPLRGKDLVCYCAPAPCHGHALLSVANATDSKENCPKCNAQFQGEPIPKKDWHLFGATHFSRKIGVSDGDNIGIWQCPDCGHRWDRAGHFAAQARRNLKSQSDD